MNLILPTELRIAYLCVLLHVVEVCKLPLAAFAAITCARLRGLHKKTLAHLLHLTFFTLCCLLYYLQKLPKK